MGGGELSEFQRGTVVGCHMCKKSVREISAMLDLPRSAVISVLLKWKREGANAALPRRGRPHKLKVEGRQVLDGAEMESALPSVCALTASGAKINPSVTDRGNRLRCTIVSPSVFGCPLCPSFSTKSQSVIQRHLLNHEASAVHFKEKIIYRCNLPCIDGVHFHCPFCGTTIIRKDTITTHLVECKYKCDMAQLRSVPPSQHSPETHPTILSSMSLEHSYSLLPSVSAVTIDHSYTLPASQKTPAVATDIKKEQEQPDLAESPPTPTSDDHIAPEEEISGDVPPTHVKCLQCPVVPTKGKHGQAKDITTESLTTCIW